MWATIGWQCSTFLDRLGSASWSSPASYCPSCLVSPSKTYYGWSSHPMFCPWLHWCHWLALCWDMSCPSYADSAHSKCKHSRFTLILWHRLFSQLILLWRLEDPTPQVRNQGCLLDCFHVILTLLLLHCMSGGNMMLFTPYEHYPYIYIHLSVYSCYTYCYEFIKYDALS